jgi:deoxyribonuclease-1-like protein
MAGYAQAIGNYDIIAVEEIRDSTGTAFVELCKLLPGYKCVASTRTGTSTTKEQYGVIYKIGTVKTSEPFLQSEFERPPFVAQFKVGNWSFSLVIMHTKPDNTTKELDRLDDYLYNMTGDVILIGDLNADCDYYETPPRDFFGWTWPIGDNADTTVGSTDCAYDRFVLNKGAQDNLLDAGIYSEVTPEMSDHYLIWASFDISKK